MSRPTRAVVDLGAIARNYRFLAGRVAPAAVIAVVKADAYGHGAVPVARRLEAEGARTFAVAIAEEGVALRRAGIGGDVLLLNYADPADIPLHRAYGLTPALSDLAQAKEFAAASGTGAAPLPVHLKLDTGMGRLGVRPAELPAVIDVLRNAKGLALARCLHELRLLERHGVAANGGADGGDAGGPFGPSGGGTFDRRRAPGQLGRRPGASRLVVRARFGPASPSTACPRPRPLDAGSPRAGSCPRNRDHGGPGRAGRARRSATAALSSRSGHRGSRSCPSAMMTAFVVRFQDVFRCS